MKVTYTAVFEKVEGWWVAHVEELPGANTQGKTLREARANLKEAIQLIVETNREIAREREGAVSKVIREELAVQL